MNASSNTRTYKVISLLLKAAIFILSFWYIVYKLNNFSQAADSNLLETIKSANVSLLLITFILMFVNWGLEAFKWKLLIAPLEGISFSKAFKSIFAGVTVSIFMPNRVGEFAGRIFFLEKADKVEATLKNFVGSAMQLLMTLVFGWLAIYFAVDLSEGYWRTSEFFNPKIFMVVIVTVVIVGLFSLVFAYRFKSKFSSRIQSYLNSLFEIRLKDLMIVFLLSMVRYWVFLFQYYLVLIAFHVPLDFKIAATAIGITFLITSAVPSFALTEVVTRGVVIAMIFSFMEEEYTALLIVSSFVVWVINLAIPALIGSAFIWKLKFFKS